MTAISKPANIDFVTSEIRRLPRRKPASSAIMAVWESEQRVFDMSQADNRAKFVSFTSWASQQGIVFIIIPV